MVVAVELEAVVDGTDRIVLDAVDFASVAVFL